MERLAEGFAVAPDDILRVLRSKFTPSASRKVKQDAKAMARQGQQTAQLVPASAAARSKLLLPAQKTPIMSVAVDGASGPSALVCSANRMPAPRVAVGRRGGGGEISEPHPSGGPASLATWPNLLPLSTVTEISRPTSIPEEDARGAPPVESGEDNNDEEERWDGEVLTESELEELMLTTKPSTAVQVGKDFFDPKGNFLYRI